MIIHRHPFLLLLIVALLAGQGVYAAHGHDEASPDGDHLCQLCLHGALFDSVVPVIPVKAPALTPSRFITPHVPSTWRTAHTRYHDSRAPPHD